MHRREPTPLARQTVTRMNRDTLYSAAVFDLDAGPVAITLPDPGKRFLSMQVIDEDEYTPEVVYGAGVHTLSEDRIGARYVVAAVRILVDPNDPKDIETVRALQDAIKVSQPGGPGAFEIPNWDASSQIKVRDALLDLAQTVPDTKGMFGQRGKVDPVRRLIGSAAAWGGNPEDEAITLNVTPNSQRRQDSLSAQRQGCARRRILVDQRLRRQGPFRPQSAKRLFAQQPHREAWGGRLVRHSVRRLRRQDSQLPAHSIRMELSGAPLSPAARDLERRVDISGGAGGAIRAPVNAVGSSRTARSPSVRRAR